MLLADLRVDLTAHARERYRSRLDAGGTDAAIRAAVRRAVPADAAEYHRYCRGRLGRPCRFRAVDRAGAVYCLQWATPDRVVLLTVWARTGVAA